MSSHPETLEEENARLRAELKALRAQFEELLQIAAKQSEARLARQVRRSARRRGWRASLHGDYEARDPRHDPDTRVDITVAGTTFAVIIWGFFRLGETGWVSIERLPETGPLDEVLAVLREALSTMPGVAIVADAEAGGP
jgi:hypothetical protein